MIDDNADAEYTSEAQITTRPTTITTPQDTLCVRRCTMLLVMLLSLCNLLFNYSTGSQGARHA